jgi:hypothetical protein
MRGNDNLQEGIFSYISLDKWVPADHPLRPIGKMVDEILKEMSPQFAKLYSSVGRPSIAPERLLCSLLLQIFYSVRSERMLIEQPNNCGTTCYSGGLWGWRWMRRSGILLLGFRQALGH